MKIRAKISLIVISAVILGATFAACTHKNDVVVSTETTTVTQTTVTTENYVPPIKEFFENQEKETQETTTTELTTVTTTTPYEGNEEINAENIDRMESGDIRDGDVIEKGDYIYTYYSSINGWSVEVADKTKSSYGQIKSKLYGLPIVSMQGCFYKCENLTSIPDVPSTVTNMEYCFAECKSLSGTIVIPENINNISYCFSSASENISDIKIKSANITKATGFISSNTEVQLHIIEDSATMNTIISNVPADYDMPILYLR